MKETPYWNVWRNGSKDEEATVVAATPKAAVEAWLNMGDDPAATASFIVNAARCDDATGVFHQFRVSGRYVVSVPP